MLLPVLPLRDPLEKPPPDPPRAFAKERVGTPIRDNTMVAAMSFVLFKARFLSIDVRNQHAGTCILTVLAPRKPKIREEGGEATGRVSVLAEPSRYNERERHPRGPVLPERARSECARSTGAVGPLRVPFQERSEASKLGRIIECARGRPHQSLRWMMGKRGVEPHSTCAVEVDWQRKGILINWPFVQIRDSILHVEGNGVF